MKRPNGVARSSPGARPHRPRARLGVDRHRAELEHVELRAVPRHPALAVEHRPGRGELHAERDRREHRADRRHDERGEHVVLDRLHEQVRARHRRFREVDDRQARHLGDRVVEELEAEDVGHVAHFRGRGAQLGQHLLGAQLRAQRQRQPHLVDALARDERGHLVEGAAAPARPRWPGPRAPGLSSKKAATCSPVHGAACRRRATSRPSAPAPTTAMWRRL